MEAEFANQRVLVVDDMEDNRVRYSNLIRLKLQCRVDVAGSSDEALAALAVGPLPALVLLDVCMPRKEDGVAICRAIKGGRLRPEIQVVMITALDIAGNPEILNECLDAGADDFLSRGAGNVEVVPRVMSKLRAQAWYLESLDAQQRAVAAQQRAIVTSLAGMLAQDLRDALAVPRLLFGMFGGRDAARDDMALVSLFRAHSGAAREGMALADLLLQALNELGEAGGRPDAVRIPVPRLLEDVGRLTVERVRACGAELLTDGPGVTLDAVDAWPPDILFPIVRLVTKAATVMKEDPLRDGRTPRGSILLRAARKEDTIRITVEDNGPGIPPEIADRVFELGVTTRQRFGGGGRGLFFVKQRIEAARGRVWCEPDRKVGACFVIELPAAPRRAGSAPAA